VQEVADGGMKLTIYRHDGTRHSLVLVSIHLSAAIVGSLIPSLKLLSYRPRYCCSKSALV